MTTPRDDPELTLWIGVDGDAGGGLPGGRAIMAKAEPSIQGLDPEQIEELANGAAEAVRAVLAIGR